MASRAPPEPRPEPGSTPTSSPSRCTSSGGLPGFAVTGLPAAAVRESKDRVRAALRRPATRAREPHHRSPGSGRHSEDKAAGSTCDCARRAAREAGSVVARSRHRVPRRARVERRASADQRRAARSARGAARRATRSCCPRRTRPRPRSLRAPKSTSAAHLNEVVRAPARRRSGCRASRRARSRRGVGSAPDLGRRARPSVREARARGRGGRRAQPADGRAARQRQEHARRAARRRCCRRSTRDEMLRVASIASVAGEPRAAQPTLAPPFRAPHHTTSAQALVGGGTRPRPGEISLAHRGVLFLDELPEFSRGALEALREPLESGVARISRVHEQLAFPAEFMLVGAMNPCPCGFRGDGTDRCHCTPGKLEQYRGRSRDRCSTASTCTSRCRAWRSPTSRSRRRAASRRAVARRSSTRARERPARARRAAERPARRARAVARRRARARSERALLKRAADRWQLSARGSLRVLKVARTIADLARKRAVAREHVAEALQLRCRDRP